MLDPGHKLNSLVPALIGLTNTLYAIIGVLGFQFVELIATIRISYRL
jgi:hypothetical protein